MSAQDRTVQDIISDMMTLMGVINQGETPNPSEQAFVFFALNRRIDQWNSRSTYIYGVVGLPLNLLATKQSYVLGLGGDLNVERPLVRHASQAIAGSTVSLPVELIGASDWNAIEEPALTGQRVQKIFIDYNWPSANMKIWPIPAVNTTLTLWIWVRLTQFVSITDPVNFPDGYLMALEYQTCMDIMPGFARQIDPNTLATIQAGAATAENDIQALNAQLLKGFAQGPIPDQPGPPPPVIPSVQPQPGQGQA